MSWLFQGHQQLMLKTNQPIMVKTMVYSMWVENPADHSADNLGDSVTDL